MKEDIDIEELFDHYVDSVEPNPDLAAEAVKRAQELYGEKRAKRPRLNRWKIGAIASACCACLVVGVVVPVVYYGQPEVPPVIYTYNDSDLKFENIADVDQFVSENRFSIRYFNDVNFSQIFSDIKTSKPMILLQQYQYFEAETYEVAKVEICLTNDLFARFESYDVMKDARKVGDITVQYRIEDDEGLYIMKAKCEVNSVRYYWNITSLQGEERIDYYVNSLFY